VLISTWNAKGKEEVEEKFGVIWKYYLMLLLPAAVGLIAISDSLYGIILDEGYAEGSIIIKIAGIGFIFMGINDLLYKVWQLKEKTKNILLMMVVSVVVNIGLNLLLMPQFGYQVSIWTTLAAYLSATVLTMRLLRKEIKIKMDRTELVRIFAGLGLMYVFLTVSSGFIHN